MCKQKMCWFQKVDQTAACDISLHIRIEFSNYQPRWLLPVVWSIKFPDGAFLRNQRDSNLEADAGSVFIWPALLLWDVRQVHAAFRMVAARRP